jgi:MFS family permease
MGVGSLAIGWLLRHSAARERRLMILMPLLAAVAIPIIPHTAPSIGFVFMMAAGLGYGSMVAPTIAMAQRLLPHRTGLASGLMMGGAWAVGAGLAPLADALVDAAGLNAAFLSLAGVCVASSLLAIGMPRDATT